MKGSVNVSYVEVQGKRKEKRHCGAGVQQNQRDCFLFFFHFSEMKVGRDDVGWMKEKGGGRSAPVLSPWVHQQQELFSALWGPSDCSVTLNRRLTLP